MEPLMAVSCSVFGFTVTTFAWPDRAVVIFAPPLLRLSTRPPETVVMPAGGRKYRDMSHERQ